MEFFILCTYHSLLSSWKCFQNVGMPYLLHYKQQLKEKWQKWTQTFFLNITMPLWIWNVLSQWRRLYILPFLSNLFHFEQLCLFYIMDVLQEGKIFSLHNPSLPHNHSDRYTTINRKKLEIRLYTAKCRCLMTIKKIKYSLIAVYVNNR